MITSEALDLRISALDRSGKRTTAAIDDLFRIVNSVAQDTRTLLMDVRLLSLRVKALEQQASHSFPTRTATARQTYSWQPGGWVDQYCAEVDA